MENKYIPFISEVEIFNKTMGKPNTYIPNIPDEQWQWEFVYNFILEELEEYKEKDPIEYVLRIIKENKFATEKEIETINNKVKFIVDDAVEFAENSPFPDVSEVYKDIYVGDYPFIMD